MPCNGQVHGATIQEWSAPESINGFGPAGL